MVETLTAAIDAVYQSDRYREFMANQGYGIRWAEGEDFAAFMSESDARLGEVMKAVGIAR